MQQIDLKANLTCSLKQLIVRTAHDSRLDVNGRGCVKEDTGGARSPSWCPVTLYGWPVSPTFELSENYASLSVQAKCGIKIRHTFTLLKVQVKTNIYDLTDVLHVYQWCMFPSLITSSFFLSHSPWFDISSIHSCHLEFPRLDEHLCNEGEFKCCVGCHGEHNFDQSQLSMSYC